MITQYCEHTFLGGIMKLLLTIAIVAGFAVAANATGTTAAKTTTTTTTTAVDCTKLTDAKAKADCEAAAHAAAPAATPAKKK